MNKTSRLFLALGLAAAVVVVAAHAEDSETITGYITDTLCGKKGANARHTDCARRAVASGQARYALYDEETRRLYVLEPQETAAQYAGQRVKVTGAVGYSPLTRAGQVYDPVAQKVHSPPPGAANPRVLDSSTLIEGALTISAIELASDPAPKRRVVTKRTSSD